MEEQLHPVIEYIKKDFPDRSTDQIIESLKKHPDVIDKVYQRIHKAEYPDKPFDDFKSRMIGAYGDPLAIEPVKKKDVPSGRASTPSGASQGTAPTAEKIVAPSPEAFTAETAFPGTTAPPPPEPKFPYSVELERASLLTDGEDMEQVLADLKKEGFTLGEERPKRTAKERFTGMFKKPKLDFQAGELNDQFIALKKQDPNKEIIQVELPSGRKAFAFKEDYENQVLSDLQRIPQDLSASPTDLAATYYNNTGQTDRTRRLVNLRKVAAEKPAGEPGYKWGELARIGEAEDVSEAINSMQLTVANSLNVLEDAIGTDVMDEFVNLQTAMNNYVYSSYKNADLSDPRVQQELATDEQYIAYAKSIEEYIQKVPAINDYISLLDKYVALEGKRSQIDELYPEYAERNAKRVQRQIRMDLFDQDARGMLGDKKGFVPKTARHIQTTLRPAASRQLQNILRGAVTLPGTAVNRIMDKEVSDVDVITLAVDAMGRTIPEDFRWAVKPTARQGRLMQDYVQLENGTTLFLDKDGQVEDVKDVNNYRIYDPILRQSYIAEYQENKDKYEKDRKVNVYAGVDIILEGTAQMLLSAGVARGVLGKALAGSSKVAQPMAMVATQAAMAHPMMYQQALEELGPENRDVAELYALMAAPAVSAIGYALSPVEKVLNQQIIRAAGKGAIRQLSVDLAKGAGARMSAAKAARITAGNFLKQHSGKVLKSTAGEAVSGAAEVGAEYLARLGAAQMVEDKGLSRQFVANTSDLVENMIEEALGSLGINALTVNNPSTIFQKSLYDAYMSPNRDKILERVGQMNPKNKALYEQAFAAVDAMDKSKIDELDLQEFVTNELITAFNQGVDQKNIEALRQKSAEEFAKEEAKSAETEQAIELAKVLDTPKPEVKEVAPTLSDQIRDYERKANPIKGDVIDTAGGTMEYEVEERVIREEDGDQVEYMRLKNRQDGSTLEMRLDDYRSTLTDPAMEAEKRGVSKQEIDYQRKLAKLKPKQDAKETRPLREEGTQVGQEPRQRVGDMPSQPEQEGQAQEEVTTTPRLAGPQPATFAASDMEGIAAATEGTNIQGNVLNNAIAATRAFMGAGAKVVIHKNQAEARAYLRQRGQDPGARVSVNAWRMGNEFHYVADKKGADVEFHELIHPVVDALFEQDRATFDKFYTELMEFKGIGDIAKAIDANYAGIELPTGRRKEVMTTVLGKVAAGELELEKNPDLLQQIKDWINKLIASLGINQQVNTAQDVRAFAARLSEAMRMGTELSMGDVVPAMEQGQELSVKEEFNNLPDDKKIQYSIIGTNAELKDNVRLNLATAKAMEVFDKSPKEIFLATGWERGVDGRWRYEVANPTMNIKGKRKGTYSFNEVLDAPDLIEAYPELQDIKIRIGSSILDTSSGHYNPRTKEIFLNRSPLLSHTNDELEMTLLHELQHAIQDIEGFSNGFNPFSKRDQVKEYTDLLKKEGVELTEYEAIELNEWRKGNVNAMRGFRLPLISGMIAYFSSAGEVEARNVQRRAKMSEETRRATPISETERIPRKYQWINSFFEDANEYFSKNEADVLGIQSQVDAILIKQNPVNIQKDIEFYESVVSDLTERIRGLGTGISADISRQAYSKSLQEANEILQALKNGNFDRAYTSWSDYKYSSDPNPQFSLSPAEAIEYNNGNSLELTPDGKPSTLYQSILELPEVNGDKAKADQLKAQVYSPEFKAWFGDWQNDPANASKVVDENGEPLMVYHGTNVAFDEFKQKSIIDRYSGEEIISQGFYTTPSKDYATYLRGGSNFVMPLFLNIKSPEFVESNTIEILNTGNKSALSFLDDVRNKGVDGIIFADENDVSKPMKGYWPNDFPQYFAFSPTQIKSVFNRGTFSPADKRIQFSLYQPNALTGFNSLTAKNKNRRKPNEWVQGIIKFGPKNTSQELKWNGLEEYLSDWAALNNEKSVPYEVVENYLMDNKVEIVEKGLSDSLNLRFDYEEEVDRYDDVVKFIEDELDEDADRYSRITKRIPVEQDSGKVFSNYELYEFNKNPIPLPLFTPFRTPDFVLYKKDDGVIIGDGFIATPSRAITLINKKEGYISAPVRHSEYQLPGGTNYKEFLIQLQSPTPIRGDYYGPVVHYGTEKNIIASVRMNDRYTDDGEKVLFLEEMQSDWAQIGRGEGFVDKEIEKKKDAYKKKKEILLENINKLRNTFNDVKGKFTESIFWGETTTIKLSDLKGPLGDFMRNDEWKGEKVYDENEEIFVVYDENKTILYAKFKDERIIYSEKYADKTNDFIYSIQDVNVPNDSLVAIAKIEALKNNNLVYELNALESFLYVLNDDVSSDINHSLNYNRFFRRLSNIKDYAESNFGQKSDIDILEDIKNEVETKILPLDESLKESLTDIQKSGDIPLGPYVTDTNQWTGLAFRRLFNYAATNGYDRIAWTTGKQQDERWNKSLAENFERLTITRNADGTFNIAATATNANNFSEQNIPQEKLSQYVGTPIAEAAVGKDQLVLTKDQLENFPVKPTSKMVKLYEDIYVNSANREARRFDKKAKVEYKRLPQIGNQPSIPITTNLSDLATQGIPQFSLAPLSVWTIGDAEANPGPDVMRRTFVQQAVAFQQARIPEYDMSDYALAAKLEADYAPFEISASKEDLYHEIKMVKELGQSLYIKYTFGDWIMDKFDPVKDGSIERFAQWLTRLQRGLMPSSGMPKWLTEYIEISKRGVNAKTKMALGRIKELEKLLKNQRDLTENEVNRYLADSNSDEEKQAMRQQGSQFIFDLTGYEPLIQQQLQLVKDAIVQANRQGFTLLANRLNTQLQVMEQAAAKIKSAPSQLGITDAFFTKYVNRGTTRYQRERAIEEVEVNLDTFNEQLSILGLQPISFPAGQWATWSNAFRESTMSDAERAALQAKAPKVTEMLDLMRRDIDSLSQKLVDEGYAIGERANMIITNKGQYVSDAFRMFRNKKYKPDKVAEKAAVQYFAKRLRQGAIGFRKAYFDERGWAATRQLSAQEQQELEKALTNKSIWLVQTMLDEAKQGQLHTKEVAEILKSEKPFIMKEGLAKELRPFFGEYSSPTEKYIDTIFKLSRLIENSRMQERLARTGMGIIFFEKTAEIENQAMMESVRQITNMHTDKMKGYTGRMEMANELMGDVFEGAARDPKLHPLNGLYTLPEIEEFIKNHKYILRNQTPDITVLEHFNRLIKMGKTTLSPYTHIKNFSSNFWFLLAQGYYISGPASILDTFRTLNMDTGFFGTKGYGQRGTKQHREETQKRLTMLIENGVIGEALGTALLRDIIDRTKADEYLLEALSSKPSGFLAKVGDVAKKGVRKITDFTDTMYSAEDDFFKIMAYMAEAKRYSLALYQKPYNQLTDSQKKLVDDRAMEIVKFIMPNYSKLGKSFKTLSRNILLGNFVAFSHEVFRITWNQFTLFKQEVSSKNPRVKALGTVRFLSFLLSTHGSGLLAGGALTQLLKHIFGDDEDDDFQLKSDLREIIPVFLHNDEIITRDLGNGVYSVTSMSSGNPYGLLQRAFNAIYYAKNFEDAITQFSNELGGPFLGTSILMQTFAEAKMNKTVYGSDIVSEFDPLLNKGLKIGDYITYKAGPGVYSNVKSLMRTIDNNEGDLLKGLQEEANAVVIGAKTYRVDFSNKLYDLSKTYKHYESGATGYVRRTLRRYAKNKNVSDQEFLAKREEMKELLTERLNEVRDFYQIAKRRGVPMQKAIDSLSGFNKEESGYVLNNQQGSPPIVLQPRAYYAQ